MYKAVMNLKKTEDELMMERYRIKPIEETANIIKDDKLGRHVDILC
jgi:hypothetical protein